MRAVHLPGVTMSLLRAMRAHAGRVLVVVASLIILLGPAAMLREARLQGIAMGRWEALYATLGLFAFASNRVGYPQTVALQLVYFAAPAVAASAVFGAFYRVLEERMPMLIGRARGHVVIGGLGNLGTVLCRYLQAHGHAVIAIERDGN